MKYRETKRDRLSHLLGEVDPLIIQEALDTDSPEALAALNAKEKRKTRRVVGLTPVNRRVLLGTVAMLAAVALILPVALLLTGDPGMSPGTDIPGPDIPGSDVPVAPENVIPPWVSGELKLSTLTYGVKDTAPALSLPSFSLLTNTPEADTIEDSMAETTEDSTAENVIAPPPEGTIPNTETEEPPVYGKGENLTVSFMDNVKITTYMGEDLIKLRPESGEHISCPDVYYDIRTNDYFCMSCHVLSFMDGQEDFADAAIRCFAEECVLNFTPLWTSGWELEEYRSDIHAQLGDGHARVYFAERKKLTVNMLGLSNLLSDEHREFVKDSALKFQYPVVDIAEYGQDMEHCLFTLVSPRTGLAYGNFICDMTTGEITRIDTNCEGYDVPNLAAAAHVLSTDGYTKVIAMVPDFPGELTPILHTGLWKPIYMGHNICLFSAETGECERLIAGSGDGHAPQSGVNEHGEFLSYVGTNGQLYLFGNGEFIALTGELARVVKDTEGECYAVIRRGEGDYLLYSLEGEKSLSVSTAQLEGRLNVANRYVVEGNTRYDLLTGESLTLWEGTPSSLVTTKDGRYTYLYFHGTDSILCLDVWMNKRGYLTLSDSFLEAVDGRTEITYNLILNAGEDCLLMAYFKEGQITFDAEAFRENVGMAGGNVTKAIVEVTDYFLINGEPLRFYETTKAHDLLRLLSASAILDTVEAEGMSRDANIAISIRAAEALIPYLEVWSRTAEVPDGVVESMLGDMTLTMFRDLYQLKLTKYGRQHKLIQLDNAFGAGSREYALTGMSRAVTAEYFEFLGLEVDEELQNILYPLVYAAMDTVLDEERMFSKYNFVRAFTSLICEITPQLTGDTYAAYIASGRFLDVTDGAYCFVTNSNTAGDIRCGLNLPCDTAYIRRFLSELEFVEGEMDIRVEGRLTYRFNVKYSLDGDMPILEVGYAPDGRAYAVIQGYYAEITPEDVEAFKIRSVDRESDTFYYPNYTWY